MANFINADLIVKELSKRCQTAWAVASGSVWDYPPLTEVGEDHVVIVSTGFSYGDGGAQCKQFNQQFKIIAQFEYPSGQTATEFRTAQVNLFLTQIYKNRHFMDGLTPLGGRFNITDGEFDDTGNEHKRFLEIRFSFQIETVTVQVPVTP